MAADGKVRFTGQADPAFTVTYTGFVNGDTAAVLTGAPALSTTATAASPAGLYPITPAAGTLAAADYAFAFVPGTLTVVSVTLTGPATAVRGQPVDFAAAVTAPGGQAVTLTWLVTDGRGP